MSEMVLRKQTVSKSKKAGRKVSLAISTMSPEDRLNAIADIIIERLLEERNKNTSV